MQQTRIDNRTRIEPELWKRYLDVCNELEVPYKDMLHALVTWFIIERRLPNSGGTGNVYYAPQPIPEIAPPRQKTSDNFVNGLLEDDLFS